MNKQYPEYAYFNGKRGVHIGKGIYKLETKYVDSIGNIFNNKNVNSYGILYRLLNNEEYIISVEYFVRDYDEHDILRNALYSGFIKDYDNSLGFYRPVDNRFISIGGISYVKD